MSTFRAKALRTAGSIALGSASLALLLTLGSGAAPGATTAAATPEPPACAPFAAGHGLAPLAGPASAPAPVEGASLAVLGPSLGWIEPCGCSGGQLGGIHRVGSAFAFGAPGAGARVAAGGAAGTDALAYPDWAQAQVDAVWHGLGGAGLALDAVGLASPELSLGLDRLSASAGFLAGTQLVATNLIAPPESPLAVLPSWTAPDGTWTLISILPEGAAGGEGPLAWSTRSAEAALAELRASGALLPGSVLVALVEGDSERALEVATATGPGSVVLWHGVYGDADATLRDLGTTGARGAFLGGRLRHVVELEAAGGNLGYSTRGVSEDLPSDEQLDQVRELYRQFLESTSPPVVDVVGGSRGDHPDGAFAGSDSCQACHEEEYAIWSETLHAVGMEALADDLRGSAPATSDPRCVSCHSVGFGYRSGYASPELPEESRRPLMGGLAGIGCESCHGPGARHNETEAAKDIGLGARVPGKPSYCTTCHDADNDPHFVFDSYWERVKH